MGLRTRSRRQRRSRVSKRQRRSRVSKRHRRGRTKRRVYRKTSRRTRRPRKQSGGSVTKMPDNLDEWVNAVTDAVTNNTTYTPETKEFLIKGYISDIKLALSKGTKRGRASALSHYNRALSEAPTETSTETSL
jgi:hypothetical protein